jgi:16S rRNA (guanine527-N7)-methyltransferase
MAILATSEIEQAIQSYGVGTISGLAGKVSTYIDILLKWNSKIALTTVTDPLEIVKFHFGESLFAISQLKNSESRLADVGTGAGFPGLPLAMAMPQLQATLIESNRKKCAFLSEVIRILQLSNATVYEGRMESFPADSDRFQFITARALGQFDELLAWSRSHLEPAGRLLLWLGESDSTRMLARRDWRWAPPKLIPYTSRRYLLSGSLDPL